MDQSQPGPAARARERRRIVAGLLAALDERGPGALRERDVIAAAATTPGAFRAHFEDLDACFDFACEAALDTLLTPVAASWSAPRPAPARLAAALGALLGSLAAQPRLAELCLRHSTARQPDRRTYRRAVDAVAQLLLELPPPLDGAASPAAATALARGALALVAARLADGRGAGLEEMRPQLLALLLPALDRGDSPARGDSPDRGDSPVRGGAPHRGGAPGLVRPQRRSPAAG